jgi:hypothetical protein
MVPFQHSIDPVYSAHPVVAGILPFRIIPTALGIE